MSIEVRQEIAIIDKPSDSYIIMECVPIGPPYVYSGYLTLLKEAMGFAEQERPHDACWNIMSSRVMRLGRTAIITITGDPLTSSTPGAGSIAPNREYTVDTQAEIAHADIMVSSSLVEDSYAIGLNKLIL